MGQFALEGGARETAAHKRPYYVATSFRCDRETTELGEDYPALMKIERAYRLLERRLARAPATLHAGRAIRAAHELAESLAEARHDASLGSTIALAKDAFAEARVVRVAATR